MLAARVATALVLVVCLLAAMFWLPATGWQLVVALITAVAAWEWAGLAGFSATGRLGYAAASCVLAWLIAAAEARAPGLALGLYLAAALFWLGVVPLWFVRRWRLRGLLAGALVGWLVLLPASLALVQLRVSPLLLLAAMATVWVADIAAYFAGRKWGRRKLAVSISPGKTWEGAMGAACCVMLYGFAVLGVSGNLGAATGLKLLGLALALLALTAVSIVGDLFESLLKRQAGVKDSSHLLPGHGGVLDRIDSLTSTLPLVGLGMLLWID